MASRQLYSIVTKPLHVQICISTIQQAINRLISAAHNYNLSNTTRNKTTYNFVSYSSSKALR